MIVGACPWIGLRDRGSFVCVFLRTAATLLVSRAVWKNGTCLVSISNAEVTETAPSSSFVMMPLSATCENGVFAVQSTEKASKSHGVWSRSLSHLYGMPLNRTFLTYSGARKAEAMGFDDTKLMNDLQGPEVRWHRATGALHVVHERERCCR